MASSYPDAPATASDLDPYTTTPAAATAQAPAPVPPPALRTGALFGHGWEAMKRSFWPLMLMALVVVLISSGTSRIGGDPFDGDEPDGTTGGPVEGWDLSPAAIVGIVLAATFIVLIAGALALLWHAAVVAPFIFALELGALRSARGTVIELEELVAGWKRFRDVFTTTLFRSLLTIAGLVLFVVPGIWIWQRLRLASLYVMDQGMEPRTALRASYETMRGHALFGFWITILQVGIYLLGLLLLFVGSIPATAWNAGTDAALYRYLTEGRFEAVPDGPAVVR